MPPKIELHVLILTYHGHSKGSLFFWRSYLMDHVVVDQDEEGCDVAMQQ